MSEKRNFLKFGFFNEKIGKMSSGCTTGVVRWGLYGKVLRRGCTCELWVTGGGFRV